MSIELHGLAGTLMSAYNLCAAYRSRGKLLVRREESKACGDKRRRSFFVIAALIPISQVAGLQLRSDPPEIKSEGAQPNAWVYVVLGEVAPARCIATPPKLHYKENLISDRDAREISQSSGVAASDSTAACLVSGPVAVCNGLSLCQHAAPDSGNRFDAPVGRHANTSQVSQKLE